MLPRPLQATAVLAAALAAHPAAVTAALTIADIQVWVGSPPGAGIAEAVLVVDWRDQAPAFAWGYRWPAEQPRTGRDLLAAVAGADPRLTFIGVESGFLSDLAFDDDLDGSPERFRPGFNAETGEFWGYYVNNEVWFDPVDFTRNGHIVPPADSVVPLGNPYQSGRWVSSSTGVLDRPLVDGSWDGFVYAPFTDPGPGEAIAVPPIPEPGTAGLLVAAVALSIARRRAGIAAWLLTMPMALAVGPYPPPAGQPGSDAVPADDPRIQRWASAVTALHRGPEDIADPLSAPASYGSAASALGPADVVNPEAQPEPGSNGPFPVISLGDGGSITVTFADPVGDGPGADIAVFENGLTPSFLELAFVEVSSDGLHFFRFPAHSLTAVDPPVGSFGSLDARNLDNLAGKYHAGFGTPFDLADLPDAEHFNRHRVTHIRVVDVIGSIDPTLGSLDSASRLINDPFPTPFESGGFDLDAVGILSAPITSYDQWQGVWEWGDAAPDPAADPDADGMANVLEYALETDPLRPDSIPFPGLVRTPAGWKCEPAPAWRRSTTDLECRLEWSADCTVWQPLEGSDSMIPIPGDPPQAFVRWAVTRRIP